MAKPKLNEIIAVVSGRKGEVQKDLTETYHKLQKPDLFDGMSRSYAPRVDSDSDKLPGERKHPQASVKELIEHSVGQLSELIDLTLTLDAGNTLAKGDIELDGQTLAKDVPVPTLLFLEKQLGDVHSLVSKIPTPDPAVLWKHDANQDMLVTDPAQTVRTKKVQKAIVLYDATDKHPAQTQLITEDVAAGDWTTIYHTTRIPAADKAKALERVRRLLEAVKTARERANAIEVDKKKISDKLLGFVFDPLLSK